jgi:hypothetical protein
MAFSFDHIRTIGSVLGILGVGATGALYFSDFKSRLEKAEGRVATVEDQLKLLSAAPVITRQAGNLYTKEAGSVTYADDVPIANPLIATCIDLVKRTATAKEKSQYSAETSLDNLLKDYGCRDLMNRLSKN